MKLLSPDSGLMRGLNELVDGVWINVLMLVTSIPLVTIGAAVTAGHDAARRSLRGQGHVTSNYLHALKANWRQSTLLWLVLGPIFVLVVYSWLAIQITPLLVPKFAVSIIWVIVFEWVWALQARFENTVGNTLKNALVVGISHIGSTAALAAIDVVYIGLVAASWRYMPQGLFLLIVLGYGTLVMVHTPILNAVLARLAHTEQQPHDAAHDAAQNPPEDHDRTGA